MNFKITVLVDGEPKIESIAREEMSKEEFLAGEKQLKHSMLLSLANSMVARGYPLAACTITLETELNGAIEYDRSNILPELWGLHSLVTKQREEIERLEAAGEI